MQPEKSLQELETELATVQRAINAPGVDPAEKQLYQRGAERIEAAIAAKRKAATPDPDKSTNLDNVRPIRPQTQPKPRKKQEAVQIQPEEEMGVITAITSGTIKRVMIKWKAGEEAEPLILTEGETRSRFTTALRDLVNSRFAAQERWEDVKAYVTYAKACTYYLALIEFWGYAPTAQQLELATMGAARQQIFLMIRESCEATLTQSN